MEDKEEPVVEVQQSLDDDEDNSWLDWVEKIRFR
jgi:hypothetical protein